MGRKLSLSRRERAESGGGGKEVKNRNWKSRDERNNADWERKSTLVSS